jgi:hypothetical protein
MVGGAEEMCRSLERRTRGEDDDRGLGAGADVGRSLVWWLNGEEGDQAGARLRESLMVGAAVTVR